MHIYLDSSALIKRVISEPGSGALEELLRQLAADGDQLSTSSLSVIEVDRGIRARLEADDSARPSELTSVALSGVSESPVSDHIVGLARRLGPPALRSLDAIHLATASFLDVDVFVAYDRRLLTVAAEMGFATLSPS